MNTVYVVSREDYEDAHDPTEAAYFLDRADAVDFMIRYAARNGFSRHTCVLVYEPSNTTTTTGDRQGGDRGRLRLVETVELITEAALAIAAGWSVDALVADPQALYGALDASPVPVA